VRGWRSARETESAASVGVSISVSLRRLAATRREGMFDLRATPVSLHRVVSSSLRLACALRLVESAARLLFFFFFFFGDLERAVYESSATAFF